MAMACSDHVDDLGPTGQTGHTGTDGSKFSERLNRYGQWGMSAAENISYRANTGVDIVMQLLIDDGVSSRGHRTNLMNPNSRFSGVASGYHDRYDQMTCITYAGSYQDNQVQPTPLTSVATVFGEIVDRCSQAQINIDASL